MNTFGIITIAILGAGCAALIAGLIQAKRDEAFAWLQVDHYINKYGQHLYGLEIRMKIYIDRLYNEWTTHGKIIIGVDFDSTISPYATINNQEDIERTISVLKICTQTGCFIVIHTACRQDRYQEILDYCEKSGIKVDSINQTPIDLPYGKSGSKPYCNHFLDDRAALPASLDILEAAMYKIRGDQQSKLTVDYLI